MILINPQLEQHKNEKGEVHGKPEELFPLLYFHGERRKDIAICWDDEGENIIVQTTLNSERLIRTEIKYFLIAEKHKAQRELTSAKMRLATIEELQDENNGGKQ